VKFIKHGGVIQEGKRMGKKIQERPVLASVIRLYPAGIISLLTFLTAFPAGYVLMIINWRRMRKREKERSYIFGLISSSLFMILLLPFYAQAGCGISIINIAFGIYFYNDMTQALNNYGQSGNNYSRENFLAGCLIGLLAVAIWIAIAAILISGINLFTDVLLFNSQR